MKNSALILFSFLLLISCSKKEEKLKEQIIGTWVEVYEYDFAPLFPLKSFTFNVDGTCEYLDGIILFKYDSLIQKKRPFYYGTKSKYLIDNDSLIFFIDKIDKKIKVKPNFSKDTLILKYNTGYNLKLIKYNYQDHNNLGFDKIVVEYWRMGFDLVYLTLYKNGRVEYFTDSNQDKKSLFVGKVNDINYYFNKFKNVNFKKLNDFYYHGLDGQFVKIKFLKNEEVIKSVLDGNYAASYELIWAYIPLLHIYEETELKKSNDIYFDKELFKTTEIDTINHIY